MKCLFYTLLAITAIQFAASAQKLEAGINGGINLPLRRYEDPGFYSRLNLNLHASSFIFSAGVEGGRAAITVPVERGVFIAGDPEPRMEFTISRPYFVPHVAVNYKARFRDAYGYIGVMSGYMIGSYNTYEYMSYNELVDRKYDYNAFVAGGQIGAVISITKKLGLNIETATRWHRKGGSWLKDWPASVGLRYTIK